MDKLTLYTANITMEAVMILVLTFLLITCIFQKKRFASTKPLIILTVMDMAMLVCQIVSWAIALGATKEAFVVPMTIKRLVYWLDYSLFYCIATAFLNYIVVHINDMYASKGETTVISPKILEVVIAWGVIISVAFLGLIFTDWFHYIREDGVEWFHWFYLVMFVFGTCAVDVSVVLLLKHKKVLGKIDFWLLITYVIVPYTLVIVDLINNFAFAYVVMALFVFILYIHIDLRRGTLISEQLAQLAEQDKNLMSLRTEILLSQIQPHFLYNTLNTISSLCTESPKLAQDATDTFADYLRHNMNSINNKTPIPFSTELRHVQNYIWIEQLRFGSRLTVKYDIKLCDFMVPSLTLQPIVENAIKHGVCKKIGGGTVTISAYEDSVYYYVSVKDDGVGFVPDEKPNDGRSHVGIGNVRTRLKDMVNGSLLISSVVGEGTVAVIRIPKRSDL